MIQSIYRNDFKVSNKTPKKDHQVFNIEKEKLFSKPNSNTARDKV